MASLSLREITTCALVSLFLGLLCIGLLPVAHAKYDISLFRTYFGCPPCDASECKNPIGCDLVKEPGVCGCCMTCSRQEGDPCGIYSEKCGKGLVCNPPENSIDGFEALATGKGICEPNTMMVGVPMARRSPWQRTRRSRLPFPPKW